MIVFKFGGASVKNANAIKNIANIIEQYKKEQLIIVVSAMGKMTNALEKLYNQYSKNNIDFIETFNEISDYHFAIVDELFENQCHQTSKQVYLLFEKLRLYLHNKPSENYDYDYDQIISFGELVSSTIVAGYLNDQNITNQWIDITTCLKTDETYREAKVDWKESNSLIIKAFDFDKNKIFLTQGFIGSAKNGNRTTLGREGSDYTAAILAYALNAQKVIIWKDVLGILNADPRLNENAVKLDEISYQEAIELAYYGAQVIHPKTIKPLQNKNIPLYVKSFIEPNEQGTLIRSFDESLDLMPIFIVKKMQVLISISPKDFSFIVEENISSIFALFAKLSIKVNLMQNSAISFSVSIDNDVNKLSILIKELQKDYKVLYNEDLELITIRHYTKQAIVEIIGDRKVLVEQKSRRTARYAVQ